MTAAPIHQDRRFQAAQADGGELRILPPELFEAARERYREMAAQERMPSPLEFTAPQAAPAWVGWLKSAVILATITVLCWTGLVIS